MDRHYMEGPSKDICNPVNMYFLLETLPVAESMVLFNQII